MAEPVAGARSVSRSAAGMGVAAGASRVIGFARVLAIAAILGTTYLGNTFTSSNYVSNVLFELLAAGALSAVLVPTLVDLLDRSEEPEAERLAGSVLGIALVVLGAVTVVGVVAAPWLAHLLASGVSDPSIAAKQESLATFLLRFFVPQVVLYAIGTVAIAVLYAKRRFVITAIAPIGNTVLIVAGLVMFRVLAGEKYGPRSHAGREAHLGLERNARRRRLRRGAEHRVAPDRLPVATAPRPSRSGGEPAPAAVGMGDPPARPDRSAVGRRDRARQLGRGRDGGVPGRVGVLPRSVRRDRPADPYRDPQRAVARCGAKRLRRIRRAPCVGRSTRWRCSSCPCRRR